MAAVNATSRNKKRPPQGGRFISRNLENSELCRALLTGNLLHQIDNRAPQIAVLNVCVRTQQAKRARDGEQLQRRCFTLFRRLALQHLLASKERADLDAEHLSNLGQPAGTDAVDAFLVL